jgi:hypothetical protein
MCDFINSQRSLSEQKIHITTFRTLKAKLGLKKCNILRWAQEETDYLLATYKTKGNREIAEYLTTQ